MKAFFFKEDKSNTKRNRIEISNPCQICGLDKCCITPKMPYTGEGKKKILIIAEAPGKSEDERGVQLIGEAGQILRKILKSLDIDLDRDCWKTNAIICRPPHNTTPTNTQINCCRSNLLKTIKELNPNKVITLGKIALQSLIGEKESITSIEKWVGYKIPDQEYKFWIFPNYHPSYLLRNEKDIVLKNIFTKAIKEAIEWNKEFPLDKTEVEYLSHPYEAILFLDSLKILPTPITIDFETTGKRPQQAGHKIICMSVGTEINRAAVFQIFDDKEFIFSLKRVLKNNKIKKVGQNIKFENIWAKQILDCDIKGWVWDTMIAEHHLDSRKGITGLKFQTYAHYGVSGYNSEVEKFIDSKEEFGFNRLNTLPIETLLKYCGLDSIYTYRRYIDQKETLKQEDKQGLNLFLEGQEVFSGIEQEGINIDGTYYQETIRLLNKKQSLLSKKILSSKELENWKGKFNFNSSLQLRKLLFSDLKYKSIKQTKNKNESTDQEVLEKINTPFTKRILTYKKFEKIKGTYLQGFLKNSFQNKLYPSYNLGLASSYRSSSDSPNFQNIPVRDSEAQEYCRTGIKPSEGNQLLEADYSGIEVRISACYHQDPVMIEYINNPESDMHRDMAKQIFNKENISKEERYLAKNNFVFPQFYGDYYVNCAANLWKNSPKESLPFDNYRKFETHIKDIEYDFWFNRFKVYNKWKDNTWKEYQRTGKIYTLTGFKVAGHFDKKQVVNHPIQGTAFHCLLWSLIQCYNLLKDREMKTKIIGQIHDSAIYDLNPDEKKELIPIIKKISTIDIREHFKWIIIPLEIELVLSEVNGNWFKMNKEEK